MERLHILSLQLDGHSRRFTFHILCTSFQEAPCVFQARACAIKYSKHSHFHSWCNGFLRASMYVCLCAGMCVCSPESIREAQRGTKRPREAQRAYSTYICMWRGQNVRAWIEQACHALGWLTGGLAGWLRPRELREALGLQLSGSYCVVLSSGNFNPQGKLGIQLSVMHCLVFC